MQEDSKTSMNSFKKGEVIEKNQPIISKLVAQELEKIKKDSAKLFKIANPEDLASAIKFPELQKIEGRVTVLNKVSAFIANFPEVQKIEGRVSVVFPQIQKVEGDVKAEVTFPKIQEVKGNVKAEVDFPETQKVEGEVSANIDFKKFEGILTSAFKRIPVGKGLGPSVEDANPSHYVPVRLTTGRQFYDVMTNTLQGMGRIEKVINNLINASNAPWLSVAYSGISNTIVVLPGGPKQFGGYFIDNPNSSKIYVQVFIDQTNPVLGTTAPDAIFGIPASGDANLELSKGRLVTSSIKVAATTQPNGNAAPTTPIPATFYYKN